MDEMNFIESILSNQQPIDSDAVKALTYFIRTYGINNHNFPVYQKILNTNNADAADIIFRDASPELFFAIIPPNRPMILACLETLTHYPVNQLYPKIILACLGILQNNYKNAHDGLKVYPLSISDLQHVGKYLIRNDEKINKLIIDLLENIAQPQPPGENQSLSIMAKDIVMAYFDQSKRLQDIIPHNLWV